MTRLTRNAASSALALLVAGVGGCMSNAPQPANSTAVSEDSAVFAAVVRVVVDSARSRVFVDPRPIEHVDSERFQPPTRDTAADRVVLPRQGALRQLGVGEGKLAIPPDCWSVLSPPDENGDAHKSGCPKQPRLIAALSVPRPLKMEPAGLGDYRAVREAEMLLGPAGMNIITYEYILVRKGTAWSLVKREPRLIME